MQAIKYRIIGNSAKCETGSLVQCENGALQLDFGGVDGQLTYRINNGIKAINKTAKNFINPTSDGVIKSFNEAKTSLF